MKRFWGFLMVTIMVMLPAFAAAFNQADVDRMVAGDKNMQNADLSDLNNPILVQQQYKNVDFSGADFSGSRMWSCVFTNSSMEGAKLDNGSFHGAHFHGVNFKGASLVNADLSSGTAGGADFTSANLSGANLRGRLFQRSKFIEADLSGADLTNGSLWNADLTGANLQGAILANVEMDYARIDQIWESYIRNQNVRNFDKIEWIQRAPIKPQDLSRPAVDKKPSKPSVPLRR